MKLEDSRRGMIFREFGIDVTQEKRTLRGIIQKLNDKEDLNDTDVVVAMCALMSQDVTHNDIAEYLTALHKKGETEQEIAMSARVMRLFATQIYSELNRDKFEKIEVVDCCGTGGGVSIFNISTAVAIILAASGLFVAKHGNRAITSQSGSADFLEALGVKLDIPATKIAECILENHIGFLFAPLFHQATKNVQQVRKQLPHKTIFNILGPLTNPACPKYQIIGVYERELTERIAKVLRLLGVKRASVVYGTTPCGGGMDEVSTLGNTMVSDLREDGRINNYIFNVNEIGIKERQLDEFKKGNIAEMVKYVHELLKGSVKGADEEILVVNAAFGLVTFKYANTIQEGIQLAREVIKSGACKKVIKGIIKFTNG